MVRDSYGSVTFEAIPSTDLKKRQKQLGDDYLEACKAYKEAKSDNSSADKPTKPAFRIIESKIRSKDSKAAAEALAAKWQEKYDAKKGKAEAKDTGAKEAKQEG